jgi:hypothetical protein
MGHGALTTNRGYGSEKAFGEWIDQMRFEELDLSKAKPWSAKHPDRSRKWRLASVLFHELSKLAAFPCHSNHNEHALYPSDEAS